MVEDYKPESGNDNYDIPIETRTKNKLSQGRQDLEEALQYMNKIKTKVAAWHGNTKEFFEEVTNEYEIKAKKMENNSGEMTAYNKFKAFCSTLPGLPGLVNKQDPTRKRLGNMLDILVNDAENIYSNLNTKIGDYQSDFEDVDTLFDELISNSKKYVSEMEEQDQLKNQHEGALQDLETQLTASNKQTSDYLDIKKNIIETKRQLEEASRLRSSALNKYNNGLNLLEALESLRDESVIMLSEGKNLYETLQNSVESLKPLFDQVTSAADLAEFQVKALEAHDMLKDTFNPAMIAITAVARGVSKVATERIGENFIEDETIETVRALSYDHQQEMGKRRAQEDKLVDKIIKNHVSEPKQIEEQIIDLGKDENGDYRPNKENHEGDE